MKFNQLCKTTPLTIKHVGMLYFNNYETAKFSLICTDSNMDVYSNRYKTEDEKEMHLELVFWNKMNMTDLKKEQI